MKLIKNGLIFIIGAGLGFSYYYFIGCKTGSCPLQSNPWFSSLWGGVLGLLLVDAVKGFLPKKQST
ncbi:MAG: hypothetical protein EHM72_00840 [Calditrichaeota bacterium]|nr:MAG: hypothetical protein EHM72_00840 [Calditrichota bacterium]